MYHISFLLYSFITLGNQFPLENVRWPLRVMEKMWRYSITPQVVLHLFSCIVCINDVTFVLSVCTVCAVCMYLYGLYILYQYLLLLKQFLLNIWYLCLYVYVFTYICMYEHMYVRSKIW